MLTQHAIELRPKVASDGASRAVTTIAILVTSLEPAHMA
jgi:hypothetical protein